VEIFVMKIDGTLLAKIILCQNKLQSNGRAKTNTKDAARLRRARFHARLTPPRAAKLLWNVPPLRAKRHGRECRAKKFMIKKLKSGEYCLYSRKTNPATGKRGNLGTFDSMAAAQCHERQVQFFKRH
jgi:hypothetical protein